MKWFKHWSDHNRGQTIQDLLNQMGHTGLCYYPLLEMCVEKIEPVPDREPAPADFTFRLSLRNVRQNLRISRANLERLLGILAANDQLSWKIDGQFLEIEAPKLLLLLSRDFKKARHDRTKGAAKPPLDKDKDKEKDIYIIGAQKRSDPMGYMKSENEPFVSFLKGLDILSPKVRVEVDKVRESFETVERLNSWVLGVTEARGFKENATNPGRSRYLTAALLREVGAIA